MGRRQKVDEEEDEEDEEEIDADGFTQTLASQRG